MDLRTILVTGLAVASSGQLLSAQTILSDDRVVPVQTFTFAPTQTPTQTPTSNSSTGLLMLQSQVVSARPVPVSTRLLSTRVVAVSTAPASQVSPFSAFGNASSFGTASIPVGAPFVASSTNIPGSPSAYSLPTMQGLSSTIGVPATFFLPSSVALSSPQTVSSTPYTTVASPGVAQILATQNGTAGCEVATAYGACSPASIQNFSNRIDAVADQLARLEQLLDIPSGGERGSRTGSSNEIDELLKPGPTDRPGPTDQPGRPTNEIDELLKKNRVK
ncbi:MAG: hypothetical protein HQ518_04660 [Rhodopirellula sp.]|nr:hypothetical protein [Rhodopirellula sp.]